MIWIKSSYSGPVWSFTPGLVGPVVLAAGLELLVADEPGTVSPVYIHESVPGFVTVDWAGVDQAVEAPLQAHTYPL